MQIGGYHPLFFCKPVSRQAKQTNWLSFNKTNVIEYSYDVSEIEIFMNMQISGQICKLARIIT